MLIKTIGELGVGQFIRVKENGIFANYQIIHQGIPSDIYDASCNGTWLTRVYIAKQEYRKWNISNDNRYAASDINNYLNSSFINQFDSDFRNAIKEIRIPYGAGNKSSAVYSGVNGLKVKIFLLSAYEIGFTTSNNSHIVKDGSPLQIFSSDSSRQYWQEDGNGYEPWLLRTPFDTVDAGIFIVEPNGRKVRSVGVNSYAYCVRPTFILPSSTMVDIENGNYDIVFNTPPISPGWCNLPDGLIGGNQTTITWAAGSDPDNNLAGYKLERSVNSGGWAQVYQGGALTFVDTIVFGWGSVQYRVKTYDTYGVESNYAYSAQRGILNNRNPGASGWCNLPDGLLGGNQTTITWAASSDPDNNLAGYKLERNVNSGGWAQVYQGGALSFVDTLTFGWGTVQYRVKSYDSYNWESGYTASPVRSVINNRAPVISDSDRALGTFSEAAPVVSYTVTDADNDIVTIAEKLDGQVLRTYTATLGAAATLPIGRSVWLTAGNGGHTLQVVANDGRDTTIRTWSFIKAETVISFTLAGVQETDARVGKILVTPRWARGAQVKVEVSNNALDDIPDWEDATAMVLAGRVYYLQNVVKTAGKWGVNIRVTMSRSSDETGDIHISGIGGAYE